jgi:hypothetical protein
MATGLKATVANSLLDALFRATNYTAPTAVWIKLHTGDPGAAGTSNAATETTRKQATFSAASSGAITTSADLTWTNVSTTETVSHWSAWDASTAGNFICSDDLASAKALTAGDTFTIASGDLDVNVTPLAA